MLYFILHPLEFRSRVTLNGSSKIFPQLNSFLSYPFRLNFITEVISFFFSLIIIFVGILKSFFCKTLLGAFRVYMTACLFYLCHIICPYIFKNWFSQSYIFYIIRFYIWINNRFISYELTFWIQMVKNTDHTIIRILF